MRTVMEELGLADLVTTIPGLTVTGAGAILAETGDPARFATPRALVKHAGLCPRDNASGAAQGKTSISGRGLPGLRLAAWRAVWAAMPNNPVMAARFGYLTTRQDNRLARQQARSSGIGRARRSGCRFGGAGTAGRRRRVGDNRGRNGTRPIVSHTNYLQGSDLWRRDLSALLTNAPTCDDAR